MPFSSVEPSVIERSADRRERQVGGQVIADLGNRAVPVFVGEGGSIEVQKLIAAQEQPQAGSQRFAAQLGLGQRLEFTPVVREELQALLQLFG